MKYVEEATFPTAADNVIRIAVYECECYCKKSDRRIGNPIATDTADALPQIDPFLATRPKRTMRSYGRLHRKTVKK